MKQLFLIIALLLLYNKGNAQIFSTSQPPKAGDHSISIGLILTDNEDNQNFSLYTENGFKSFVAVYFGLGYSNEVLSFTLGPELPLIGPERGLLNTNVFHLAIYPSLTYDTDKNFSLSAALAFSRPVSDWLEPYLGFGFSYPFEDGSKVELSTIAPGVNINFTSFNLMVEYDLKSKLSAVALSWSI